MRRLLLLCVLSITLPTGGHPVAAGRPLLTNGRIRAEFGDRGLVSLADGSPGQNHRFTQDDFALTIDSRAFDSRSLPAPSRTVARDRVTFAWTAGPYRLNVVYELARGWRFLSKQISIVSAPGRTFHVNSLAVFRSAFADPIADVFVPKSVRPSLGTGDYGACFRFDAARALLAIVQNPFLQTRRDGQGFSIAYAPEMDWNLDDGPFVADRGLLVPAHLTGRWLPASMRPEWQMPPATAAAPVGPVGRRAFETLAVGPSVAEGR